MRFRIFLDIFHFLGGVLFAIFLLLLAAIAVGGATFLEARYSSHLYAVSVVYGHPLFTLLLVGFFCNILFAALRRWPFQRQHIPFLLTHLGLLLILSGVIAKNRMGLQGNMGIWEGNGSHEIWLPETQSLLLGSRDREQMCLPFDRHKTWIPFGDGFCRIRALFPDSTAEMASWFHNASLTLMGTSPLALGRGGRKMAFAEAPSIEWHVVGLRERDWLALAKEEYLEQLDLVFADEEEEVRIPVREALEKGVNEHTHLELEWNEKEPHFQLFHREQTYSIPLQGADALFPIPHSYPFAFSLHRQPLLLFLEDEKKEIHLFVSDPFGRIHWEPFPLDEPHNIAVYEQGFGGYATFCKLPFLYRPASPEDRRSARKQFLREQIVRAKQEGQSLADPLLFWDRPEEALPLFLEHWHEEAPSPLFVTTIAAWKGAAEDELSLSEKAEIIKRDLLTWQIDPSLLYPPLQEDEENALLLRYRRDVESTEPILLEAPLTPAYLPKEPDTEWEKRAPLVFVSIEKGGQRESLPLRYDREGTGIRWPVLDGEYRISFVPQRVSIPYHFRLRQAREIFFPQTNQPYSYECDAIVTHRETGEEKEVTLSMNRVYATPDGYRFYLANIHTSPESGIHFAHIAVNYDPFKRWLTYPGIFFVVIGAIGLLFFSGRKKR